MWHLFRTKFILAKERFHANVTLFRRFSIMRFIRECLEYSQFITSGVIIVDPLMILLARRIIADAPTAAHHHLSH